MVKKIKNIAIIFLKYIYELIKKIYMIFCNKIYGINKKNIVFTSFGGKAYSDNPRAISEKLHEMNPNINIIWLFIEPKIKQKIVPDYVTCVKLNSFKALKVLATSRVWVDNFNKPLYLYKSTQQIYIQTWHGDRGFKKILHDSTFIDYCKYKLFESEFCDLTVAGSKYGEMQYKSAFKYSGDILKKGYPRNDILIQSNADQKKNIKKILELEDDLKILLYAPTLRRESSTNKTKQKLLHIDLMEAITTLEQSTNQSWVCLVRAHSAVVGLEGIPNNPKFIDVSGFEDMSHILLIADMLITDYSSSAGDYALLNKPIVLFQNDRDDYLEKDRTFYFDISKSPFKVAMNQVELINFIKSIDTFDTEKNCKEILEFYGAYETGKASEEVAQHILDNLEGV